MKALEEIEHARKNREAQGGLFVFLLAEITKWAGTVKRNGEKIGKKAETLRKRLTRNLSVFEKHLAVSDGQGNGVLSALPSLD